jgi:AMMECR1 domain-containing protein
LEFDLRSFPILLKILLVAAFCCQSALAFADGKIKLQPVTSKLQTVDSLPDVVRQTLALHFGQSDQYKNFDELAQSFAVPNKFKKPAGLFVTLSRKGKTRACWGSMYPQYPNLVVGAVYTTESALSKEYRYKKIKEAEWQLLKPQVTVVRGVEPITSINDQNPLMYGLMVRTGNKSAVILPGEAIDAHYQLMMCKVKAGIASNQPCQIYRIKADVFK